MTEETPTPVEDSYIETVEEAKTLLDGNPSAVAILALDDMSGYLQEATRHIDALPLRGRRYEEKYLENGVQKDINGDGVTQTLEFPRIIDCRTIDWDYGNELPIVPDDVKLACLEEAMAILAQGTGGRKELQEQGVQSFSIGGKLSETFVAGAGNQGLVSAIAKRLMRKYVGAVIR